MYKNCIRQIVSWYYIAWMFSRRCDNTIFHSEYADKCFCVWRPTPPHQYTHLPPVESGKERIRKCVDVQSVECVSPPQHFPHGRGVRLCSSNHWRLLTFTSSNVWVWNPKRYRVFFLFCLFDTPHTAGNQSRSIAERWRWLHTPNGCLVAPQGSIILAQAPLTRD